MKVKEIFCMDFQDWRLTARERPISSNKEKIQRSAPQTPPPPPLLPTEELRIALIPVKGTLLLECAATHLAYCCPECYDNTSESRFDLSSAANNTASGAAKHSEG